MAAPKSACSCQSTYKVEHFIADCLRLILAQMQHDFEIVAVTTVVLIVQVK